MEAIFQQAPFDDKNDIKRIEAITKEFEQRIRKCQNLHYGECSRCKWLGRGFASVCDGQFTCLKCLLKDEIERRFKEAR